MIVHTHVTVSNAFPYSNMWKLLAIWSHSWEIQGFTPIVTTQELFKTYSSVDKYLLKIKSFPSINPPGFDYAAFSRWIAAYVLSSKLTTPIISTESDLINYNLTPDSVSFNSNYLNICRPEGCPVFAYSDSNGFKTLLEAINNYQVQEQDIVHNQPHLSDQDFICKYFTKNTNYLEIEPSILGIVNVFDSNWLTASVVHYGNPFIIRNGNSNIPKYELIPKLRELPTWQIHL